MPYFYVLSSRDVIERFQQSSSESLKLEDIDHSPDGDGLFFDLDSISSIAMWIHENSDVLVAAANLLKAALDYFNQGKSKGQPVTVIIRLPDEKEERIAISSSTTEEEIAQKIKALSNVPETKT